MKREYKAANKTREGYIDESDEEDDLNQLSGAGKAMRKLMKKLEKNNVYDDSDDEKNPYASSVRRVSSDPCMGSETHSLTITNCNRATCTYTGRVRV